MLILRVDGQFTDTTLETLERDPLLSGDNGGVRFLFDAAFPFSYSGAAPVNGAIVKDIAEVGDGELSIYPGQTLGFSGGGFDFSTLTATGGSDADNYVLGGPSAWSGVFSEQEYLVCVYMKLPTESDWAVTSIMPFFASSAAGYQTQADPILMCFGSPKRFEVRRQTAINVQTAITATPTGNYGQVCQVAFWRTATQTALRVKGPGGTQLTTAAAGSLNTADFSSARPMFGSPPPFTNHSSAGANTTRNFRLYRGFIENIALSGRDPASVLDADYARVVSRAAFS